MCIGKTKQNYCHSSVLKLPSISDANIFAVSCIAKFWLNSGMAQHDRKIVVWEVKHHLNPLLHRLFLDNDIIFYFYTALKKLKKKIKLSFEFF